ncbi:unnamed protein product, partial [Cylicostephanus goldi]
NKNNEVCSVESPDGRYLRVSSVSKSKFVYRAQPGGAEQRHVRAAEEMDATRRQRVEGRPKGFFTPEMCKAEFERIMSEPCPSDVPTGAEYSRMAVVEAWLAHFWEEDKKDAEQYEELQNVKIRYWMCKAEFERIMSEPCPSDVPTGAEYSRMAVVEAWLAHFWEEDKKDAEQYEELQNVKIRYWMERIANLQAMRDTLTDEQYEKMHDDVVREDEAVGFITLNILSNHTLILTKSSYRSNMTKMKKNSANCMQPYV